MATGGASESLEIERKYAVSAAAELPDAARFLGVGFMLGEAQTFVLEARYFDTPELDLAAQRVAVRCRLGGPDEGWHLKEKGRPEHEGTRELHWPIGASPDPAALAARADFPAGLASELSERLGVDHAARVGVIATLRTSRTVRRLSRDGVELVELADDHVDATNELTGHRQRWREWEAELLPGADPLLLDHIEPLLNDAHAQRVTGTSKIQRTMSASSQAEGT